MISTTYLKDLQAVLDTRAPKFDRLSSNQLKAVIDSNAEAIRWVNSMLRRGANHVILDASSFPPEMTCAFNARNAFRAARKLNLIPAEA